MEKDLFIAMVEGQIGYTFVNKSLFWQAFTRRSYTAENGGENNEVLEFIGDKALDFAVVKLLSQKFGNIKLDNLKDRKGISILEIEEWNNRGNFGEFNSDFTEGELTKIKSRMVEKKYLASRIDELGFAEGLIMGNSDIKNNVQNEASVKEDLFEAIIGAVVIDCGWDFSIIQSVVEAMIVPEDFFRNDEDDNYVRLIYEWEMQENSAVPWFWFKKYVAGFTAMGDFFDGITNHYKSEQNSHRLKHSCELKLLNDLPIFRGFGVSKNEARMNACEEAYKYLVKNGYIEFYTMRDEIDEPTKEDAINQLEILARRGYFSIPTYSFSQKYDKDGNPIWTCECKIEEYSETKQAVASSKKDAKKASALAMLEYVLSKEDE